MALGALMAAVECDLPVAYVEPAGYEVTTEDPPDVPGVRIDSHLAGG